MFSEKRKKKKKRRKKEEDQDHFLIKYVKIDQQQSLWVN